MATLPSEMDPYPPKDVLNTLLAVQALLVAASTLATTIARAPVERPTRKDDVPFMAAATVAGLMVVVAIGGLVAWWQVFIANSKGIEDAWDAVQALALVAPLILIAVFGVLAARWSRAK